MENEITRLKEDNAALAAALEDPAEHLSQAWKQYVSTFGIAPSGTMKQLRALVSLAGMDRCDVEGILSARDAATRAPLELALTRYEEYCRDLGITPVPSIWKPTEWIKQHDAAARAPLEAQIAELENQLAASRHAYDEECAKWIGVSEQLAAACAEGRKAERRICYLRSILVESINRLPGANPNQDVPDSFLGLLPIEITQQLAAARADERQHLLASLRARLGDASYDDAVAIALGELIALEGGTE